MHQRTPSRPIDKLTLRDTIEQTREIVLKAFELLLGRQRHEPFPEQDRD
jgi:hypothetical protein